MRKRKRKKQSEESFERMGHFTQRGQPACRQDARMRVSALFLFLIFLSLSDSDSNLGKPHRCKQSFEAGFFVCSYCDNVFIVNL